MVDGDAERERKEIKERINRLEIQLIDERSSANRSRIMREISRLSSEFARKSILPGDLKVRKEEKKSGVVVDTFPIVDESSGKRIIRDKSCVSIPALRCVECHMVNLNGIETEVIECDGSILIENVIDSRISCVARQVRLVSCKNIILTVHTATGVFLQHSSGITIKPLALSVPRQDSSTNKYDFVCDFSAPGSTSNYKLVENATE